ncbi:MAG TPA: BRO family protein [Ktedonobacterales bacterium]|jgi:DNA-damage-inducible protein D
MADDTDDANCDDQAILPFDDGSTGRVIRQQWHDDRWYFSVIDVVAVLTDSSAPRQYWSTLKKRLHDEGADQSLTDCLQLKMRSPLDGKLYKTDVANTETMLRIVQSIPSPKAEPVKQWLAKVGAQKLDEAAAAMTEAQKRLLLRGEVTEKNRSLTDAAKAVGVLSSRDFGIFQDWGYRGLYAGEDSRSIAERKGLAKGEHILDHMNSNELAMNWLRITQTDEQLRTRPIADKDAANEPHFRVGKEIRAAVERIGGTMPEDLPTPAESIQQLEQAEQARVKAQLQPSLFPDADEEGK